MARTPQKKTKTKATKAAKPAAATEAEEQNPSTPTPSKVSENELVSGSDVDFSSEDEIEIDGITENVASSTKSASHIVNLSKDRAQDSQNVSQKSRGTLYVGSLPKMFQQYELKKYFSQFGDITRVRLSRNKKTGRSRCYGFVEFKDPSSAEIAAETMNNYLISGTNLKVQVLKDHADNLFSSKMKSSFGEFDWRSKESNEYNAPKPLEVWKQLQQEYEQKKTAKFEELKLAGFEYALEA